MRAIFLKYFQLAIEGDRWAAMKAMKLAILLAYKDEAIFAYYAAMGPATAMMIPYYAILANDTEAILKYEEYRDDWLATSNIVGMDYFHFLLDKQIASGVLVERRRPFNGSDIEVIEIPSRFN